jgi:hypothetical protein
MSSSRASECETEDLGISMVGTPEAKGQDRVRTPGRQDLEDDVQQASATCPL